MKFLPIFLLLIFFAASGTKCYAQRDYNTSSARAAYSMPSSNWYHKSKKKTKSKNKNAKRAKKARKSDSDVARERRRSLHF